MNKSKQIKRALNICGKKAKIVDANFEREFYNCIISSTWRRNKTNFEPDKTDAGFMQKDFYVFIAPFDMNIMEISNEAHIECMGDKFVFKKKEPYVVDNIVQFYWGILRICTEDKDGFFE